MPRPVRCLLSDGAKLKLILTILLLVSCGIAKNLQVFAILFVIFLTEFILLKNKKIFIHRFVWFLPFLLIIYGFPLWAIKGEIVVPGIRPALLGGISYEGLYKSLILGTRALLATAFSLIFIASTGSLELAHTLDWLTHRKLKLGETTLIALNFIRLIKDEAKRHKSRTLKGSATILKQAIKRSQAFAESLPPIVRRAGNAKH